MRTQFTVSVLMLTALGCALVTAKPHFPTLSWDRNGEEFDQSLMPIDAKQASLSEELEAAVCDESLLNEVEAYVEDLGISSLKKSGVKISDIKIESLKIPADQCSVVVTVASATTANVELKLNNVELIVKAKYKYKKGGITFYKGKLKMEAKGDVTLDATYTFSSQEDGVYSVKNEELGNTLGELHHFHSY